MSLRDKYREIMDNNLECKSEGTEVKKKLIKCIKDVVLDIDYGNVSFKKGNVYQFNNGISVSEYGHHHRIGIDSFTEYFTFNLGEPKVNHDYLNRILAEVRKETPVYSGFIKYFPNAIKSVARLSFIANEQHHPDKHLHWDMEKSKDELDACMRHLIDHASGIEFDDDGVRHLTKCAWRMMGMLERTLTDKF